MVLKLSFIVCLLVLVACSSNQKSEKTEMLENIEAPMTTDEARVVYSLNCAACHGQDGKMGASNSADLSKSKLIEIEIENVILNGNAKGMMPYKEILSEREVAGLVDYVQTLRK